MVPRIRRLRARGVSLIETVMVMVLLAAVTAVAAPALTGFGVSSDDATAKLYLTTVVDAQAYHHARHGGFVAVSDTNPVPLPGLVGQAAGALALIPGDTVPSGAQVSAAVAGDGHLIGLATKPGNTCWYAVRSATTAGQPTTWWGYSAAGATACTGAAALGLPATTDPDTGFGQSPATPAVTP